MNAAVLLNKPAGLTSFSAVKKCGHLLGEKKGGHTGTLDPNATGLMICLFGAYTKLVPYAISGPKTYEADFVLGKATDTEDIWGNVLKEEVWHNHSEEELKDISASFLGKTEQIPPMYSALRYQGKRLYELARQGKEVERKAREVEITELTVNHVTDNRYHMHACVSAGTYIRTLIADYGQKMGELACMTALKRTAIGNLQLDQAANLEEVGNGKGRISPLQVISPDWHQIKLEAVERIADGKAIQYDSPYDHVIFTNGEIPLAAYEKREDGQYHCVRGLK